MGLDLACQFAVVDQLGLEGGPGGDLAVADNGDLHGIVGQRTTRCDGGHEQGGCHG